MQEVLALALGSMQNDMRRLDQVGMNLANAVTPGYKRGMVVQQGSTPFAAAMDAAAAASVTTGAAAPLVSMATDARTGTLKGTGQSLDVAIGADGYFEVATDQGPAYTRQGSFRVDAQGRLVTAQGQAVMGLGGELFLTTPNPVISPTGVVTERVGDVDRPVGQIKLMRFPEGAQAQRLGDGLLASAEGMTQLGNDEVQLRQGFTENSNVNSAQEMTQLIQTMRHFESMHRVAQSHDDMLATAVRRLGENS